MLMLALFVVPGCQREFESAPISPRPSEDDSSDSTGQAYLIEALDELEAIAAADIPLHREYLGKITADTVIMYGALSPEGTGMVITERHTFPKGLPLITVRKSYGSPGGVVASGNWSYSSEADFRADHAEQWSVTEVVPASMDTIVTRVTRSTGTQTFTFRLPVVTRSINTTTGVTQESRRFAQAGSVITEVTDGNGGLIRRTRTTGLPNGALQTTTEQPDGSWRNVVTLGQADGTIVRTVTIGG